MIAIANILFLIATITLITLFRTVYFIRTPGGDAGVGYSWALIYFNVIFFILTSIVFIIIGKQGGLEWVHSSTSGKWLRVGIGLFSTLIFWGFIATIWTSFPVSFQLVIKIISVLFALLFVGTVFIMINNFPIATSIASKLQMSLKFVSWIGFILVIGLIVRPRIYRYVSAITHLFTPEEMDSNNKRILEEIETCDLDKDMIFLTVHTEKARPDFIRKKAVEKIRSKPDWQEDLAKRLDSGWSESVFQFLGSNDVDNPELFKFEIIKGIKREAESIKKDLSTGQEYNLYEGMFNSRILNVVLTVDRFKNQGVDYKPALKELRNALEVQPERKPIVSVIQNILDKWLKTI